MNTMMKVVLPFAIAASFSAAVNAEPTTATVQFQTVAPVQVFETQVVDFGKKIMKKRGDCVAEPILDDVAASAKIVVSGALADPAAGICDGADDILQGTYELSGVGGAAVTVKLIGENDRLGSDWGFTPKGKYIPLGVTETAAANATAVPVDNSAAGVTNALSDAGNGYLVVAGTLTINNDALDTSAPLTSTFTIDVVY